MLKVLLMATLLLAGCASGPSLSQAIAVHNTAKHVIEAADAAVTPVYHAAAESADAKYPDDEVAYGVAMADYNAISEALINAKKVEQGLNLAIDQWQAGADDGHMTKEVAACAGDAMLALGQHAATLGSQVGNWVYASVTALSFQLTQLADGTACTVK